MAAKEVPIAMIKRQWPGLQESQKGAIKPPITLLRIAFPHWFEGDV